MQASNFKNMSVSDLRAAILIGLINLPSIKDEHRDEVQSRIDAMQVEVRSRKR